MRKNQPCFTINLSQKFFAYFFTKNKAGYLQRSCGKTNLFLLIYFISKVFCLLFYKKVSYFLISNSPSGGVGL